MNPVLDTSFVVVLLMTLMILGASRLVLCVRLVAVQGMLLSFLPLTGIEGSGWHIWLLVLGSFCVKGFLLPWLLLRARREADVSREIEPYVGFGTSILAGVLMLAVSFWLHARLPVTAWAFSAASSLAAPVSFFGLFAGLFLIVSRRKALTQVLGYLVLENGIYTFGMSFVRHQPFLVEMGVLLDLLVGVFVMGIMIFHISREFDHIDADQLSQLHDVMPASEVES